MIEYGLGESTFSAIHVGVPRSAGIDSDPVNDSMVHKQVEPHYRFHLVYVGKTVAWGVPEHLKLAENQFDDQAQLAVLQVAPASSASVLNARMGCA